MPPLGVTVQDTACRDCPGLSGSSEGEDKGGCIMDSIDTCTVDTLGYEAHEHVKVRTRRLACVSSSSRGPVWGIGSLPEVLSPRAAFVAKRLDLKCLPWVSHYR